MRQRSRDDRPRLRKALGQHHLKDARVTRPLVDFLRAGPGSTVLEVGAGGGVLTGELVGTGAAVVAVELDLEWVARLAAVFGSSVRRTAESGLDGLRLVAADALELAWERLPAGWRVAGNLPYNVGTVIVERLLAAAPVGTLAGFLLQREVVDRLVARPGDDAYGALSVLVAARASAVRLGRVRPGAFVPPPAVESAFVGFETLAPPLERPAMAELDRLVRAAFAQRRKSLRNALGAAWGRAEAERRLAAAAIDSGRRAETLGLDDFLRLHATGHATGRATG